LKRITGEKTRTSARRGGAFEAGGVAATARVAIAAARKGPPA
jgi:hypothetical protein